jgi:hypothetical protein
MREELEQAKNDFYSGNGEMDSQEDSQDIRPSIMENNEQLGENENRPSDPNIVNYQREGSSEEVPDDFNEEVWLKKWAEENPEIMIPKEKEPQEDLDLDPEFDLENFQVD